MGKCRAANEYSAKRSPEGPYEYVSYQGGQVSLCNICTTLTGPAESNLYVSGSTLYQGSQMVMNTRGCF